MDKSPNKLVWLVGGGFLCIGGIIALLLLDGLAAAFACVALLALCNAIVASAQGTYALEIPVSRQVGSGRTVGIYNITERLGQMLGPVALGQVIALWGVNSGLLGMAAVLAVLNILFALTGRLAKAGACRIAALPLRGPASAFCIDATCFPQSASSDPPPCAAVWHFTREGSFPARFLLCSLQETTMRNSVGTAGCRLAKEHT